MGFYGMTYFVVIPSKTFCNLLQQIASISKIFLLIQLLAQSSKSLETGFSVLETGIVRANR